MNNSIDMKSAKAWAHAFLGEIAVLNPKMKKEGIVDDMIVSFIPMASVQEENGLVDLQKTRKAGEVKKGYTSFVDNDILFAKIAPCMENGKVAIVHNLVNGIGYGSTEFHVIRPCHGLSVEYLQLFLAQRSFRMLAKKNMTGSAGQLRVPLAFLNSTYIPLPPLPEQRAIVAKIESLFSELDAGAASLETAKAQLKVYRQAVLKAGFEGGLVDSVNYSKKTLSSISGLITKGSSPKWQGFKYTNETDSLLFITSENVRDNYLDLSAPKHLPLAFSQKEKRSQLKENDVLLNIVGASIGRAAVFKSTHDANINQAVALIRLNKNVFPSYVSYFLNSTAMKIEYRKKAVDVARANISLKDVGNIVIPLPETQVQSLIVSEIESRLSLADKLEETIDASLAQAASLRQSILKQAFEGKLLSEDELEACRREPDWESAEQLLERIKAERAASGEGKATAAQRKRAGKRSRAS